MKRKKLIVLVIVLAAILAAELIALGVWQISRQNPTLTPTETLLSTTPTETIPVTQPPTEPTPPPTTLPPETEPQPESFLITLAGDCTLGCNSTMVNVDYAFPKTVGEDYDYSMANVKSYFENDDYSLVNLEGVLGEEGYRQDKKYAFRGSAEYTNILTRNSVEGVTIANNHSGDYGKAGYEETMRILEEAGLDYVEDMNSILVTTESGLTIGIYAADSSLKVVDQKQIIAGIQKLKEDGAELIICAFHWGRENTFRTIETQVKQGRAAIDAGAHIVWGHHPHVLQPMEEYNGGLICYSLGNFVFGGNTKPKDFDTAFIQQEIIRHPDGTIELGTLEIIPCSVSSITGLNNYQPTPYAPDSEEYARVLSKLDGTYTGSDLPIG